jgi:type I restriction enzyme S subunit
MTDIKNIPLFEPPVKEQIEINKYLIKILSKYDKLIQSATDVINLTQERRTALISTAVTGKIDVRNWQAAEAK